MQIRELMSEDPIVLNPDASCVKAAAHMRQHHCGDILVQDDDGSLLGIVTDRDIAMRCVADGRDPALTTVRMVCTTDPVSLAPTATVDEAIQKMAQHHVRRIPITENGRAIGIVSLGDLAESRDGDSVLGQISAAEPDFRARAQA